jgi:predicted metal-dependent peptidase
MPNIEVVLDVSGSISPALLKGFLMQLVTLFESVYGEDVTIKVGCFSNDFGGFTTIKTVEDIKKFKVTPGGGTNFEIAATAFSQDRGRNTTKIVFTDGVLGHPQRTRADDIIWIVFGDSMNFKPVGGRIVNVSSKDYDEMIRQGQSFLSEDVDIKGRHI